MQQIALAQTEEYANSGDYYTQGDDCETTEENSDLIETNLFGGGDVITEESGYEMCIQPDGTTYLVKASDGNDPPKILTMTANGVWTGK